MSKKPNSLFGLEASRFTFWNGDYYVGEFTAVKDKQQIIMEGNGTYTTADHEIYEGKWNYDSLIEAEKIIFPDQSEFSGTLNEMIIQGSGKYRFKENVELEGNFINSRLMEDVYLRDPEGHLWKGYLELNKPAFIFFYPCHSFWQFTSNLPKKNNCFYEGYSEEQEVWEV